MSHLSRFRCLLFPLALTVAIALVESSASGQRRDGVPALPPPDEPVVLHTAETSRIRVVPVVAGLSHPWGIAFRRNGDILVTERDKSALRVIRNGQLLERPIPGVPEVFAEANVRAGLMDVAVHPEDDSMVYLTYSKAIQRDGAEGVTVALARGRLEGGVLTEVRDIFVAEGLDRGIAASRLLFAPDGTLFMTVGGSYVFADTGSYAQDPSNHFGKLMRLNDDGSPPDDNPFTGNGNYLPEIYSMGHRNQLGLTFHPETGDLWATENGPQGGDDHLRAHLQERGKGVRVAARVGQEPGQDREEAVCEERDAHEEEPTALAAHREDSHSEAEKGERGGDPVGELW